MSGTTTQEIVDRVMLPHHERQIEERKKQIIENKRLRNRRKRASRTLRGVKKKSTRTWVSWKQAIKNGQVMMLVLP